LPASFRYQFLIITEGTDCLSHPTATAELID